MNREERMAVVNKLLTELHWFTSTDNEERMENKQKETVGICVDMILTCIDFAEERGKPVIKILDFVALQAAAERGFPTDPKKAFSKIDKIYVKSIQEKGLDS